VGALAIDIAFFPQYESAATPAGNQAPDLYYLFSAARIDGNFC